MTKAKKYGNMIPQDAPRRAGIMAERHRDSGAKDSKPGTTARNVPLSDGGPMPSPDTPKQEQSADTPKRDLVLNSRADLRDLLVKAGLARGAAEKVARGGWPALAGEITETDLAEEAANLALALAENLKDTSNV